MDTLLVVPRVGGAAFYKKKIDLMKKLFTKYVLVIITLLLLFNISFAQTYTDNFNSNYSSIIWGNINNGSINASCGSVSGNTLHFISTGLRSAETNQFLNVNSISFYLKFGTESSPSSCENADSGEDVALEYSIDGINWTIISIYDTEIYTSFTLIQEAIPSIAHNNNTYYRLRQISHSDSNFDSWAIDNFSITVTPLYSNNTSIAKINFCTGNFPVSIDIQNLGNNTIDTVTVNWSVNNTLQTSQVITSPIIVGNTYTATLNNYNFILGQNYTVKAWTSLPNNTTDGDPSNDTLEIAQFPSMIGTYTIGGTSPDYSTLTSAVNDLHTYGICGAVIFNIRDGNYNETLTINEIIGSDSINTITFQSENGDSTQVIVTSTLSSSQNVVRLNGADWITFRGMTLESNANTGYSQIIQLYNGAEHNTFENNVIRGRNVSNISTAYVLIYSGNDKDDYTTIRNNHLEYGSYGVYLRGTNTSNLESGLLIENNVFETQYYHGIFAQYQDAPQIINNNIETNSTYSSSRGILLSYCDNQTIIANNSIKGVRGYGLVLENCNTTNANKARVFNNYIYMPNNNNNINNNNIKSNLSNNSRMNIDKGKLDNKHMYKTITNHSNKKYRNRGLSFLDLIQPAWWISLSRLMSAVRVSATPVLNPVRFRNTPVVSGSSAASRADTTGSDQPAAKPKTRPSGHVPRKRTRPGSRDRIRSDGARSAPLRNPEIRTSGYFG